MWLVFEGLDKVGKTTLEWEVLKASNFKHVVIDRGPVGYMTFDQILGRVDRSSHDTFKEQAKEIVNLGNTLVIMCYANENVVNERLKKHNEKQIELGMPYDVATKMYTGNASYYYGKDNVLMLDTTKLTIDECVDVIMREVKGREKSL